MCRATEGKGEKENENNNNRGRQSRDGYTSYLNHTLTTSEQASDDLAGSVVKWEGFSEKRVDVYVVTRF